MNLMYSLLTDEQGNRGVAPMRMTDGSVGYDLTLPTRVVLFPGARCCVSLLIAFEVQEPYYIEMGPRSSLLVKRGIHSPVSYIDTDYKASTHAILINLSDEKQFIEAGTRILQIIVREKVPSHLVEVSGIVDTGRGGMGSTG